MGAESENNINNNSISVKKMPRSKLHHFIHTIGVCVDNGSVSHVREMRADEVALADKQAAPKPTT